VDDQDGARGIVGVPTHEPDDRQPRSELHGIDDTDDLGRPKRARNGERGIPSIAPGHAEDANED